MAGTVLPGHLFASREMFRTATPRNFPPKFKFQILKVRFKTFLWHIAVATVVVLFVDLSVEQFVA